MEKTAPRHARIALALALLLPAYFAIAALGSKFGLWGWQSGLGAVAFGGLLVIAVLLLAIVSLILVLRKPGKSGWPLAAIALAITLGLAAFGFNAASKGAANPVHDVATDPADPPQFSDATMDLRQEAGANPVNDYSVPLGELAMWEGAEEPLSGKSHADLMAELYPDLEPVALDGTSREDAIEAVAAAMEAIGLSDIRSDPETGRVEGVAETFWFGFKDDVVARVGEEEIDLRSVSRVGQSDLGTNAARLRELRAAIAERL